MAPMPDWCTYRFITSSCAATGSQKHHADTTNSEETLTTDRGANSIVVGNDGNRVFIANKGDLRTIAEAGLLSLANIRNMHQHLGFAFVYNSLGIPLAVGLLCPLTEHLHSPMIAALAMSLSSVLVIANALRLRVK